ncbi:hypothetical protein Q4566_00505 [Tamlana sp. 2_MG-2023]|uniref:hypothetical protein n=1 Tax=unclassified Tamlana TaxID=2614803 RepID=UPI0026E36E82|nr:MULTISPECIES: hypothetical protein [unclassified Tamlana]MDO6758663.1 hypothetical protein [Tamlana sp. 2_MG-2023]MDO6789362.1 hypothetical protein [Tamlana sp. 1_MG-2023]
MDELDLLKKDWNQSSDNHKVSAKSIYAMLHKKSSSIVKTLFYISIAELVFWILINVLPTFFSKSYNEQLDLVYSNKTVLVLINVVSYAIILLFVYLLFKSQKAISVTDNAKKLMESILKTRKIIKYYVLYNLIVLFISIILGLYFGIKHSTEASNMLTNASTSEMLVFYGVCFVMALFFLLCFWLFYKLLYGLLLKRLNRNYRELKKLEV